MTDPDLPSTIPDELAFWLYDPTGHDLIGQLGDTGTARVLPVLNKVGSVTFQVPLQDPSVTDIDVTTRQIVKASYRGEVFAGCQLMTEECEHATNDGPLLEYNQQPDLFGMLNSGTLLPEKPVRRYSDEMRWFGFMASTSIYDWQPSSWSAPTILGWSDDTGVRRGKPAMFAPYGIAGWAAAGDPYTTVPDGTVQWFLRAINIVDTERVTILAAADDFLTLYVDGNRVASPDYENRQSWRDGVQITVDLDPGPHIFAAKIENAPAITGHSNPVAFIFAVVRMDTSGNLGPLVLYTDSDWLVWTGEGRPGWFAGSIAYQAFAEMAAIGDVNDINSLTCTFTSTTDSNGDAWAGERIDELGFQFGSTGLADMCTQLASQAPIDFWVDAATMTFNAVNRMDGTNRLGADKTSSVEFKLGNQPGGSLLGYRTKLAAAWVTDYVTHDADSAIAENEDADGIAAVGRIYGNLDVGGTGSPSTRAEQMSAAFAQVARPVTTATMKSASAGPGPLFLTDWRLGDSVKAPGHRGSGTVKFRITSACVERNDEGDISEYPVDMDEDLTV